MFLRCTNRKKDGKEHRYWNVVENRRVSGGRVVQRQVLYLGEINGSQRESWRKTIEVFKDGAASAQTMALFPEDRPPEIDDEQVVGVGAQRSPGAALARSVRAGAELTREGGG